MATKKNAFYAQSGGAVGSNKAITLSGSTWIRGDARAGPGYTTSAASLAKTGARVTLRPGYASGAIAGRAGASSASAISAARRGWASAGASAARWNSS